MGKPKGPLLEQRWEQRTWWGNSIWSVPPTLLAGLPLADGDERARMLCRDYGCSL